jgi:hypothetical protein
MTTEIGGPSTKMGWLQFSFKFSFTLLHTHKILPNVLAKEGHDSNNSLHNYTENGIILCCGFKQEF